LDFALEGGEKGNPRGDDKESVVLRLSKVRHLCLRGENNKNTHFDVPHYTTQPLRTTGSLTHTPAHAEKKKKQKAREELHTSIFRFEHQSTVETTTIETEHSWMRTLFLRPLS